MLIMLIFQGMVTILLTIYALLAERIGYLRY